MLEKDVERILVKAIKDAGGIAYKFTSPGNDGVPDRVVCLPGGYTVFVEVKTDKGKLSRLQERQIARLRSVGQTVDVVYGVSGIVRFLTAYGMIEQAEILRGVYGV